MIELLILIAGIVALWKFHRTINSSTIAAQAHAEEWSERIIADADLKRQDNYREWVDNTTEEYTKDDGTTGSRRIKIVSHEEMMRELTGNKKYK
jgi:hypothetical protein